MNSAVTLAGWTAIAYFMFWRPVIHRGVSGAYRFGWFVYGVFLASVWLRLAEGVPVEPAEWAIVAAGAVLAGLVRPPHAEGRGVSKVGVAFLVAAFAVLAFGDPAAVQTAHNEAVAYRGVDFPAWEDNPWTAAWWTDMWSTNGCSVWSGCPGLDDEVDALLNQ